MPGAAGQPRSSGRSLRAVLFHRHGKNATPIDNVNCGEGCAWYKMDESLEPYELEQTNERAYARMMSRQARGVALSNAIKAALLAGVALGTEELPIKIKLVAPPLYVMLCSALDKAKGIALLTSAIDVMRAEITQYKGDLQVKAAALGARACQHGA